MSAETMARELEQDQPQSPGDRQYIEACEAAGIEPDLARRREYPKVLVLPVVDRGRRVGDPCHKPATTLEVIAEAIDFVENEAGPAKGSLLTSQTIFFLVKVRNGGQMLHRGAALLLEAGLSLRDVRALWPRQIKDSPLRKARNDLKLLRKGGAK